MSRYIDAEKIEYHEVFEGDEFVRVAYGDDIDELPTADVVERKRGKNICDSVIGHCEFKCSICGADALSISCGSLDGGKFNYCPNCGADMRGERDD